MNELPFGPHRNIRPDHHFYTRGYLPHVDAPWEAQMVTFRLDDALPRDVIAELKRECAHLPKDDPKAAAADKWLDAGHGDCILKDPRNAKIVRDVMLRDAGRLYTLMAWVIMPNHVHAILQPFLDEPLWSIVQTWKSVSSHRIQKRHGSQGRLWQRGYFDRMIRNDRHLAQAVLYIENNPVKAGLAPTAEAWPWSSAADE